MNCALKRQNLAASCGGLKKERKETQDEEAGKREKASVNTWASAG
jgi:hypothetical protein